MRTKVKAIGPPCGTGGALRHVRRQRQRSSRLEVRRKRTGRSEVTLGGALDSTLTIPGLTTKCANFLYKVSIKNEAGTGKGEVTELPLYECTTDSPKCAR